MNINSKADLIGAVLFIILISPIVLYIIIRDELKI